MSYSFLISPQIGQETITFKESHIIRALDGINPKRLKMCSICNLVFWAKKINANTCGEKKCADDLGNKKRLAEAKAKKEKQNNHFQSRVIK